MFDDIDRAILTTLQENARTNNADIARQVGMAPSAILERVRKLESRGVIQGYTVRLDPARVRLGLLAFVFVKTEERAGEETAGRALAALSEVQEVHHVAGEDCYLVKVRAADTHALGRLLRETIGAIPAVVATRTTVVLESLKEGGSLPLTVAVEDDHA